MPQPISATAITAFTATSAAGTGCAELHRSLNDQRGGLRANDFSSAPLDCFIGRVDGLEQLALPAGFDDCDSRNNRLGWLGLNQDGFLDAAQSAIARHGADRVALLIGTSTSSIGSTEQAYRELEEGRMPAYQRHPEIHTPHSLGVFLTRFFGLRGPCMTTATACSSSAKIFAQGERMLRLGLVDAVILAGVDSLCDSVLFGFNSLELVSGEVCRPYDTRRDGISIGEAAGFALLERGGDPRAPQLLGWGESSDAHHMSTPHPEGLGALLAMRHALARAGLEPAQIDYINLHGTATPKNDEVEGLALIGLFPPSTRASSSKGWTGHTLGAAGILEASICLLALRHGLVPGTLNCEQPDPVVAAHLALANEERQLAVALSNSFGFGGSNCALVFARGARA